MLLSSFICWLSAPPACCHMDNSLAGSAGNAGSGRQCCHVPVCHVTGDRGSRNAKVNISSRPQTGTFACYGWQPSSVRPTAAADMVTDPCQHPGMAPNNNHRGSCRIHLLGPVATSRNWALLLCRVDMLQTVRQLNYKCKAASIAYLPLLWHGCR